MTPDLSLLCHNFAPLVNEGASLAPARSVAADNFVVFDGVLLAVMPATRTLRRRLHNAAAAADANAALK